MNAIEELEKYIKDEGISQISGGVFKEFTAKRLIHHIEDTNEKVYEEYTVKPNTTVEKYCIGSGHNHGLSGEEYAAQLLRMMKAPGEKIVGECKKCFALMTQAQKDVHECDGKGQMTHEEWMESIKNDKVEPFVSKEGDTSGHTREIESIKDLGRIARLSGEGLKGAFEELLDAVDEENDPIEVDYSKGFKG